MHLLVAGRVHEDEAGVAVIVEILVFDFLDEGLLQRVARLAGDVPALAELDINPLIASPSEVIAVDVRAKVMPVSPGPPPDLRQMA